MKRLRRRVLEMITPRIFEIEKAVDQTARYLLKKEMHAEMCLAVMSYLLDLKV